MACEGENGPDYAQPANAGELTVHRVENAEYGAWPAAGREQAACRNEWHMLWRTAESTDLAHGVKSRQHAKIVQQRHNPPHILSPHHKSF